MQDERCWFLAVDFAKPLGNWMSVRLLLLVKTIIFHIALKNHDLAKVRMSGCFLAAQYLL